MISDKIKTLSKLARLRQLWAWEGKKVVFTNGVFDIFHAGHAYILEKSRNLGDVLIVGLNKDASARRLGKGPQRPINKWKDRAAVLCAMSAVDAVIGFEENTPAAIMEKIRPDIFVKGGDWRKKDLAEGKFAEKIVIIPLKKGYSTTSLVRRLKP
ncbi:MAG: hypothetical protein A3J74_10010 [Elusimicrobia bacterium RIFCSPHIGHO2_02_FULL_57_9]|nr:MAG: hypothetical protein A3J74_10010 [Elusimicrobia bacterium RIFCSPHIGHO2_02_FULL_57_9]